MTTQLVTRAELNRLAIIPVANATERDEIGIPQLNARVHRADTGAIERWTGTAWVTVPVAELVTDISALEASVAALQTAVTAAQAAITTLQADVNTAEADIVAAEAAIVTLQNDVNAAEADIAAAQAALVSRVRKLYQAAGLSTTSVSEVSLASYSLPAGTLAADGQALRIVVHGEAATQGGTVVVKFGATTVATLTPAAGNAFAATITITRTGAATQRAFAMQVVGTGAVVHTVAVPAETLSGAVTIDFRGSVTSGGTLTYRGIHVEHLAA